MVSQTISLPECRLASTTTSLEATLRSSLTLDLEGIPPTVDSPATQLHTFDDLVRAKEVNDLWIQRVGGTRLVFSLSGLGGGTNNDNHGCLVASWIEGHPSLHQLGITLVRIEDGEGTGTEGMPMSFSVGHADMASCMVAPRGAPVAGLRCVTCYVGLSVIDSNEGQDGSASRRKKRVKRRHAVTDVSSTRGIVEAALGLLLHGSGRRYAGFSVSGRSLGLKALAPGVFDYVHLMEISTRARLMPTIATALARMAIAESPSLRRKTMAMADEDDVAGGMEQGLWKLVMRHTITPRQRVSRTSGKPTGRHESAEGPLLVLDDDGSLDSVDGPTLAFEDGSIDDGPTLILGDDPGVSRRQESRSLELWDAVSSLSPSVSWSTRASSPSISPSLLRQQPGQQRRGPLSFEEQDDDAYEQRFPVTAPCAASSSQPLEIHDEPTTPPLQFYSDG